MALEWITHISSDEKVTNTEMLLESSITDGLKCDWKGNRVNSGLGDEYQRISLSWEFDWRDLEATGVTKLYGRIVVHTGQSSRHFEIDMTHSNCRVQQTISGDFNRLTNVSFGFSFMPYGTSIELAGTELLQNRPLLKQAGQKYGTNGDSVTCQPAAPIEDVSYDEVFQPSENNDAILVIDGKKLHVNKAFLSYHSGFFRALFSSKFKEGQMDEITIKDVSFKDFRLLMSIIYPTFRKPNDGTVWKLLPLAKHFMIPAVTRRVEHHLLHYSRLTYKKLTWLADRYGMTELLEMCLRDLDTVEKVETFMETQEYEKLSKDTKSTVLDRHMELI